MNAKRILRSIGLGTLATCLTLSALFIVAPSTSVSAADLQQDGTHLENLLKREQIVITNQQERLNLSNQAVNAAQQWIADLQAEGKDTAALQTALTAFQNSIAQAQSSFDTAKGILDAHAGFDASGNVTDRAQALKTVVDAGRAERQFHLTITQATINFRTAVHEYRQSNS